MGDDTEQRDDKARQAAVRAERLAQALRANLKRRKTQSRGRTDTDAPQRRPLDEAP